MLQMMKQHEPKQKDHRLQMMQTLWKRWKQIAKIKIFYFHELHQTSSKLRVSKFRVNTNEDDVESRTSFLKKKEKNETWRSSARDDEMQLKTWDATAKKSSSPDGGCFDSRFFFFGERWSSTGGLKPVCHKRSRRLCEQPNSKGGCSQNEPNTMKRKVGSRIRRVKESKKRLQMKRRRMRTYVYWSPGKKRIKVIMVINLEMKITDQSNKRWMTKC